MDPKALGQLQCGGVQIASNGTVQSIPTRDLLNRKTVRLLEGFSAAPGPTRNRSEDMAKVLRSLGLTLLPKDLGLDGS